MSLYRGAGGASDATDDSTVNAVAGYASSAASSASAAAASATTATNNATAAATSASQAASSVSTAASSAANAATSASNAASSASSASSSASNASSSASSASTSAGQASNYASEALGYRDTASTHATNAASSASAAAGSATSAADSAADALAIYGNTVAMEAAVADAVEAAATAQQESQDASDSAIAAAESEALAHEHEQNAAEWASFAQVAAGTAVSAATSANAAWDQFDDRYLGAKASDPTADNDGNLLVVGALYFNTSTDSMKVYTGSVWTDAYTTGNGVLLANNNLSDLQSVSTARDNLGLGSIAIQDASSVTITGGAISGITDLSLADGGTGASNAADARTNLGLGTAAVLNAGSALGVATLDGGGTVPTSQLPAAVLGSVKYQGTWDASTNTPTLVSSTGTQGYYYVVSTAGSTNLDGISEWKVGDWAIYSGTAWQKIDNTDQVTSVNGYTGTVSLTYSDVGAPSTTGTNATGTWGINVTGNAGSVTDGVYTTGDQTIGGNKTFSSTITGSITGNAGAVTNGVYTTGSYADPSWITSIAGSKVTGDISGNAGTVTNGVYTAGDQTIAGTKTFSSNPVLSAGTVNGLAFLNASKVLTTGSALTFDGTNFATTGSVTSAGASNSGNLTFTGTGNRITGDFSNATAANRVAFQTSTTNGNTTVGVLPNGTGNASTLVAFNNSDPTNANPMQIRVTATEAGLFLGANGTASGIPMTFWNGGSERMRIDTSGHVGIGTSSPITPNARLSVKANGDYDAGLAIGSNASATNWARLDFKNTNAAQPAILYQDQAGTFTIRTDGAYPITFNTNGGNERARIDSSGNLLVGASITVLSSKILGNFVSASNTGLVLNETSGASSTTFATFSVGAVSKGSITWNGSAVAYNTSSDYRLKENIQPMTGALAKVAALKPCTYKWKADGSDGEGFIAHELAEVVPQCVTGEKDAVDADGNPVYQGIDTSFLVATLTAAIQEQQAIINQLKSDVAALKGAA